MVALTASHPQQKVYISGVSSPDEKLDWNQQFCLRKPLRFENLFFLWIRTKTNPFKYFQERELWRNICFLIRKVNFWIHDSCNWKWFKKLPWTLEISHCKFCQNQYFSARHADFDASTYFDQKKTNMLSDVLTSFG